MNYPLISEYIEAIKSAEDNFGELSYLRPVLGDDGLPLMTSGNFAVVFKMKDEQSGKFYAVKCFTKEQEGRAEAYREIAKELENVSSPYILSIRYLDKELFVDTEQTTETEFPVLLMDWVEGKTLDKYLRENLDDKYALEMLAYRFSQLAQWLIPQPFAHGDLKPDNILVREDGTLVLVDYDGMYVPAMKGQKARELGSPDFRHPLRTENDFDEHIDDFSIVSILLSLKVISDDPTLLEQYGAIDRLLLSENDYINLFSSSLLKAIIPSKQNITNRLAGILILELSHYNMVDSLYRLIAIPAPSKYNDEVISTEITIRDWENSWEDEFGVRYNKYGDKLLRVPSSLTSFTIKEGTKVICDMAFCCSEIEKVDIPVSVNKIGKYAFMHCKELSAILIPDSVTFIGECAFKGCFNLKTVSLPNNLSKLGKETFFFCENLESIIIPSSIQSIGEYCFYSCSKLQSIDLPDSIEIIEKGLFKGCFSLSRFNMPPKVTHIREAAFLGCTSLLHLFLPESLASIEETAFAGCKCDFENNTTAYSIINRAVYSANHSLLLHYPSDAVRFTYPRPVVRIGAAALAWCSNIPEIVIPDTVLHIGDEAFWGWTSNQTIYFEESPCYRVEMGSFSGCRAKLSCNEKALQTEDNAVYLYSPVYINNELKERKRLLNYFGEGEYFEIPSDVSEIADGAFMDCISLKKVVIPESVNRIGDSAFYGCKSLEEVRIPDTVKEIGDSVFQECESLVSTSLPCGLVSIGDSMFWGCRALRELSIPKNVKKICDYAFWGCSNLKDLLISDSVNSIGKECFWGGWGLKVELPQSLSSVGDAAFANRLFTSIFVPNGKARQFERLLGYPTKVIIKEKKPI